MTLKISPLTYGLLLGVASLSGCGSDALNVYPVSKQKTSGTESKKAEGSHKQGSGKQGSGKQEASHNHRPYDYQLPANWTEKASSGMRLASFNIDLDGQKLDASIIQLGQAASDVPQNVNRWRGQVSLKPALDKDIDASAITKKSALGSFRYWKITNAEGKGNNGILAAMYHLDTTVVFVKTSATLAQIDKIESSFVEFCESLKTHSH